LRDCTSTQVIDGSTASRANTARSFSALMQRRSGRDQAQRQQHQRRSAPADIAIELERARDHRRRQHAAAAVADDDDLVGFVRPRGRDDTLRTGFDRGVEAGRPPARANSQIGQPEFC
jgi:hypothetical protein